MFQYLNKNNEWEDFRKNWMIEFLIRQKSFEEDGQWYYYYENSLLVRFNYYYSEPIREESILEYVMAFPENFSKIRELNLKYKWMDISRLDLVNLFLLGE